MSIQLYALGEMYQNVINMVDEDSPDQDVLNALATIEGQVEVKAGNIAHIIKTLESEAEVIKAEEKRLAQRRRSRENTVVNIKQYLQDAMTQMGLDKIKTPTRTLSLQNNPPALQITDKDLIPQKFLTLIPEHFDVRNKDVAEAIKNGEEVPGAILTVGRSLRIR